MLRVPGFVKRKKNLVIAAVALYVGLSPIWGPAAEAAFHLEYVTPPTKGLNFLPAIEGLRTQPPPRYEPLRATGTRSGPPVRIVEPQGARCGGSLPSCSIMMCESGGSLTARNPSGAAGKWQMMPGTWNGYGGYSSADQAPEHVQDAKARELWAGGRGAGHWRQCL